MQTNQVATLISIVYGVTVLYEVIGMTLAIRGSIKAASKQGSEPVEQGNVSKTMYKSELIGSLISLTLGIIFIYLLVPIANLLLVTSFPSLITYLILLIITFVAFTIKHLIISLVSAFYIKKEVNKITKSLAQQVNATAQAFAPNENQE